MQIDYQRVDPAVLTAYARGVADNPLHTLRRFLPDVPVTDIDVLINQVGTRNRAARFRAFDTEVPIGGRPTQTQSAVRLPPIGEKRVLGEYDRLRRYGVGQNAVPAGALRDAALDDTDQNVAAILTRMEMARGDVLTDGKFTIVDENGLKGLEVDYGVPSSNIVAPGTLWTDHAAATVVDDLTAWQALLVASGGEPAAYALTSLARITDMRFNLQIRQRAGLGAGTPDSVGVQLLNDILVSEGLPIPVPYDTLATNYLGTTSRVIAADRVILLPQNPRSLGYTAWGIPAEALALVDAGRIPIGNAAGLAAYCMTDGDAVSLWTKAAAIGMPVIENPGKILIADVA